jgi:oligopeptide/dipeptide ABC transporter ATP-binding protein
MTKEAPDATDREDETTGEHLPPVPARKGDPSRDGNQALVYVQKLTKAYPIRRGLFRAPELLHALGGVSFYLRPHETLGIVGESGSGKSTLGRCVLRLVEPTLGRVIFDGHDLMALSRGELRRLRRRMQIVLQNPYTSLAPHLCVEDIVAEGLDVFGLAASRQDRREQVRGWCHRVGLGEELMGRYPHELSGGQRQRVAIARALAVGPDFLVLDEPTSALDVSVQAQIVNLLQELKEELGLTQLFISHDLRVVQHVSDRLGVMFFGKLVELGRTGDVVSKRRHPYTRALFDALPSLDGSPKRLPLVNDAESPSPIAPPRGCAFFARCPNAEPGLCDIDEPTLNETAPRSRHRVACWHPCED